MSQLQTQQPITSRIRSHIEYSVQSYYILVLIVYSKLMRNLFALEVSNTIWLFLIVAYFLGNPVDGTCHPDCIHSYSLLLWHVFKVYAQVQLIGHSTFVSELTTSCPLSTADHNAILFRVNAPGNEPIPEQEFYYDFAHADYSKLIAYFLDID